MPLKNKADISELNDALHDLREANDEARDEGFPQPSKIALENAERLLREMYGISPRRFEVYPTPDGEIVIDAPNGQGRSVILLCDSEGGALCLLISTAIIAAPGIPPPRRFLTVSCMKPWLS